MFLRSPTRWAPLLFLAFAACDQGNPAASRPAAVSPEGTTPQHTAAVPLGTYAMPTGIAQPGQTPTTLVRLHALPITLQADRYILLRVGGTMLVEKNPWRPNATAGVAVASYTSFASAQNTGRGHTNVWLRPTGANLPPSGGEKLSYYFRPDAGGGDEILLVKVGGTGAELWAEREQMPGAAMKIGFCLVIYCTTQVQEQPLANAVWVEDFYIAQPHEVSATLIPEPLAVTAPASVVPGDTATFTAQPYSGLRLRNRNGTAATVTWRWYPADTLAQPNPHIGAQAPPGCQDQTVCRVAGVTKGGRMQVTTTVEGASVIIDRIVRLEPFKVSMDCTPGQVSRGGTISCEAMWTPTSVPASRVSFNWRFEPDSVRVFPAANAQAYAPPPARDTTAQGMGTWSGHAALGGRVIVRATYGTDVRSDTSQFGVAGRTGGAFGDLPVTFASGIADIPTDTTLALFDQPDPSGSQEIGVLGENYDTSAGIGIPASLIHGKPTLGEILSGPNQGLWYVIAPDVESTRGVRIRTWLTGGELPKFLYSLSPQDLLTNRGLLAARRTGPNNTLPAHPDSSVFMNGVMAHETYGTSATGGSGKGHQGELELAARSLETCGKVPAILERVVAADSFAARTRATTVVNEGKRSLYAAMGHDRVHGNFSNAKFYEVVASTTVADLLTVSSWADGDMPAGAAFAGSAPTPAFNCSRVY
jgi:hypothetical protein